MELKTGNGMTTFQVMAELTIDEFPFVEGLPKREKSKLASLWDHLEEARAVTDEKGLLIPLTYAAKLGGVSHQRIFQLCETGHLEKVMFADRAHVTEDSLVEWVKSERLSGRHVEATYKSVIKAAFQTAFEPLKNRKKSQK